MNKLLTIGMVIALVMSAIALVQSPAAAPTLGGTTNFDNLQLDGGQLMLVNTSATSTIKTVGCIQANATSSATNIKLVYNTVASSTGNGFVLWAYGTCP